MVDLLHLGLASVAQVASLPLRAAVSEEGVLRVSHRWMRGVDSLSPPSLCGRSVGPAGSARARTTVTHKALLPGTVRMAGLPPGFEDAMPGMGGMGGRRPRKPVDTQRLYDILGVNKNDPPDVIKKAYRKLAVKNHPAPTNRCASDRSMWMLGRWERGSCAGRTGLPVHATAGCPERILRSSRHKSPCKQTA